MSKKKLNRNVKAWLAAIEDAGGTWNLSKDGHAKIYAHNGRYLLKIRTSGKDTGDNQGTTGSGKLENVLRQVREEQP